MALLSFGDEAEEEEIIMKTAVPKKVTTAIEDEEFDTYASGGQTKVKRMDKGQKENIERSAQDLAPKKEEEPVDEKKYVIII
jgi:hypothetical protein